jgi:hypothetical protein
MLPEKLENFGKLKVLFSIGLLYELKTVTRDSNDGNAYSGVTLGFYFGTGSKSSDLNEIFLMCYK